MGLDVPTLWIQNEMGEKGLEPIRPFGHTVLSRARLPVPPPAHCRIQLALHSELDE